MKYTKKQIEAMTPEQLKRAVATDVMGLSIYHYDKDYEANCYYMLIDKNMDAVANDVPFSIREGERKTEEEAWADCPKYSSDISASWEVVSKFDRYEIGLWEGKVTASFGTPGYYASGETAPLAICRAALLAVME